MGLVVDSILPPIGVTRKAKGSKNGRTSKLKIIDNPSVAESYANKLITASFDGGAVVITLGAMRFVPEQSAETPKEQTPLPVHVNSVSHFTSRSSRAR